MSFKDTKENKIENKKDLIFGLHSIKEALLNPKRIHHEIHATFEAMKELKNDPKLKKIIESPKQVIVQIHGDHQLQQLAKKKCDERGFHFTRMSSKIFLESDAIEIFEPDLLFEDLQRKDKLKILCLDQVTDVQNVAAILRTCAFFSTDYLIISQKNIIRLSPGFFRISSGGTEFVKIIRTSNLSRLIRRLQEENVYCVGFSEKGDKELENGVTKGHSKICLVLGAEDKGLSNSVERVLKDKVAIQGHGEIKSLNVSVASALAMAKFFN